MKFTGETVVENFIRRLLMFFPCWEVMKMTFIQFAVNNVKRNTRVYLAYFLSSVFTIMVFFSFAVNLFHPVIADRSGGAVELIMGKPRQPFLYFHSCLY